MAKKINKWNVTIDRYVVFIDIMGFKDLVARSKHEDIYEMMKSVYQKLKELEDVEWIENISNLVTTTTYSDSIIIYSKDNTFESLDAIICTAASISDTLFKNGVPFKGALAFGTMTLDTENSIFFGQPLIDAYLLQDELLYYGIVVHGSAEEKIEEKFEDLAFVWNYEIPLKKGKSKHRTIYPMSFAVINDEKEIEEYNELRSAVKKLSYNTSGSLRIYVDNSNNYLDFIASITKIKKKINP